MDTHWSDRGIVMDDDLDEGEVILDELDTQGVLKVVTTRNVDLHEQLKEVSSKRRLSFATMKKLSRSIRKLRREDLTGMVRILKDYDPVRFRSNDELWFDIIKLDIELLLQLWRYVEACKRPRKIERVNSNNLIAKGDHELVNLSEKVHGEKIFIDLTKDVLDSPCSKTGKTKRRLQKTIR